MRFVIDDVHEFRAGDAGGARARAHRQLVAKAARGGLAHARHVQVLAQHRRRLDVEVVERDDAIERSVRARNAAPLRMSASAACRGARNRTRRSPRAASRRRAAFRPSAAGRGTPGAGTRAGTRRPCDRSRCTEGWWAWPAHREYISRRMVNCVGCPLFAVLDSHTSAVADSRQRQASCLL